jgi:3-hydroxyisobutyrate dehydrogenase
LGTQGEGFFDTVCSEQVRIRAGQQFAIGFARVQLSLLDFEPTEPRHELTCRCPILCRGEAIFNAHKQVLDAFSDAARYIGPIGAGSVAKLVHNCAGYGIQMVLAEVFSMGIKAGVEPLALWEAVRTGASGRQRTTFWA